MSIRGRRPTSTRRIPTLSADPRRSRTLGATAACFCRSALRRCSCFRPSRHIRRKPSALLAPLSAHCLAPLFVTCPGQRCGRRAPRLPGPDSVQRQCGSGCVLPTSIAVRLNAAQAPAQEASGVFFTKYLPNFNGLRAAAPPVRRVVRRVSRSVHLHAGRATSRRWSPAFLRRTCLQLRCVACCAL